MINFSVHNSETDMVADKSTYKWDEDARIFSSKERSLIIDFGPAQGITFKLVESCKFTTGDYCVFNTGYHCAFITGSACAFCTGAQCTFTTGDKCTFKVGQSSTIKAKANCVAIRYDVDGITNLPEGKTIRFNNYTFPGYSTIEDKVVGPCDGKVIEVDGKKYKLIAVE
jgi:hypothetical protein